MRSPWRVMLVSLMTVLGTGGLLFSLEEVRAGTPITGDIIGDTVWSPSGSPYWIETDVTVRLGVELVILAGTEIRFNGYYRLNIVGRFLVEGNATDPVIFTHNSTTPSPGDWVGLIVYGEAHIEYANISYARTGTYIASSFNTINESSFYRNNWSVVVELSSSNLVRNNTFYNSTDCGVIIWQSDSNTITGNNATRNGDTGICLYEASDNVVSNNTLYRNYWNGIRISGTSLSNVVVENTVLESRLYQGIGVWGSHDNWILNNTIRRNKNNGIYLDQSSGNNISWNEITGSVDYHGISLYMADSNVMIGNHIYDVWRDGIYMASSFGNRVYENTIHDNEDGIYMYDSWMNEIAGNNITSNLNGIVSWVSPWSDITSNNISWNSNIGILLEDNNNDATIAGNTFFWNTGSAVFASLSNRVVISSNDFLGNLRGVRLTDSSNVTISQNNFTSNNWLGVDLSSSNDVSVYHNNFISNANQASDDGGAENDWDDGYPSGGNYWDDYSGIDIYSGPNQDQPGSDWIGDSPYVIDLNTQDDYPLTYPYGISPSLPPTSLGAHLSGEGFENVTLIWNLSGDDGSGKGDVVEYSVYRGTTYSTSGQGYLLLATLTNGTATYVDPYVGEGSPNSYFYVVCAVNTINLTYCALDQAAKFTRPLASGPNLVSIPLIQSDEDIETVLQTVQYDKAWFYESSSQEWKWHMTSKGYRRGLWNLNHTMGMWLNVTENSNLTVAGVVPAQTTIRLHGGWNLVGFPSFNATYTVADLKAETGATRVEGYDLTPPYFLRVMSDAEVLQAGYGYWVKVEATTVWTMSIG